MAGHNGPSSVSKTRIKEIQVTEALRERSLFKGLITAHDPGSQIWLWYMVGPVSIAAAELELDNSVDLVIDKQIYESYNRGGRRCKDYNMTAFFGCCRKAVREQVDKSINCSFPELRSLFGGSVAKKPQCRGSFEVRHSQRSAGRAAIDVSQNTSHFGCPPPCAVTVYKLR